jgi:hypothetical protein
MKARLTGALLGVGTAGILIFSGPAFAQDAGTTVPNCTDTGMFPNPIFLTGSTAFEPTAQAMAALLNSRSVGDGGTAGAVQLIYQLGSGSCAGVGAIRDNANLTGNANYFIDGTPAGVKICSLDANSPKADVAISDVFYETCGLGARPTSLGDIPGPAQAMLFVVPTASQAPSAITYDEAVDVWGCGSRAMVMPWLVESAIQQRSASSGTQNVIARTLNVLASSFHGTPNTGTGNVINTLLGMDNDNTLRPTTKVTIADPSTAIGFIAADSFDSGTPPNRQRLRALAFRGFEQTQAFFADSSAELFDKRNVRDGHYLPWGYEHLIVNVDSSTGKISKPAAQNFVDWVLANPTTPENAPGFDPVRVEAAAHVIPLCAMKVQRSADGGFLSSYTSPDSCNCLFETVNNNNVAPTGCLACDSAHPCATGACRHGYCE